MKEEIVICVKVTLPKREQKYLGIDGFTMKATELSEFIEDDFENWDGKKKTFTIEVFKRSKKWFENLPEANI